MNGIVISSLAMVLAWAPMAPGSSRPPNVQGAAIERVQSAAEFLGRWKDGRNQKLVGGALWTASHSDDIDEKQTAEALERVHMDVQAIRNGDPSALEPRAIKAFKERLSRLLEDGHQGIRALAAVLLGVCGDTSYASGIAVLLEARAVTGGLPRFDRGRAAIALGLLGAKEYTLDLVVLLKSSNSFDRSGAAFGLGALRARDQEKVIAQLLNDEDEQVREAAKESLAMMREPPR
jgi:HEAT repeat protein